MPINTKSIRTKLLVLLALIALAVGGVSVVYDLVAGESVIRDQIVKRGRYVASNLAFNAKYGVLTEDKPLLTQFLEGASGSTHNMSRPSHGLTATCSLVSRRYSVSSGPSSNTSW